jgi:hypothetical protein
MKLEEAGFTIGNGGVWGRLSIGPMPAVEGFPIFGLEETTEIRVGEVGIIQVDFSPDFEPFLVLVAPGVNGHSIRVSRVTIDQIEPIEDSVDRPYIHLNEEDVNVDYYKQVYVKPPTMTLDELKLLADDHEYETHPSMGIVDSETPVYICVDGGVFARLTGRAVPGSYLGDGQLCIVLEARTDIA